MALAGVGDAARPGVHALAELGDVLAATETGIKAMTESASAATLTNGTGSVARFVIGDSLTVLRSLPDASVDLVLSSPPFLGLRSYLPADHPNKAREVGSEGTPGEFIDTLLDIVEECRRVLAPHGSLCFELGDTYAGSGNGPDSHQPEARGLWHERWKGERVGWPLDKSLCLIPESLRWAMVYGRNPFTGRETPRWRARNVVRWCRPNPPVGALADKFRPATSEMIVACTGRSRYFDLDGVRVPFTGHAGVGTGVRKGQDGAKPEDNRPNDLPTRMNTHDGAPPLDWWEVSTEAYPGSHYATWPRRLLIRPIVAMCPPKVCTTCGKPSERITETLNGTGKAFIRNRSMAGRKDGPTKSTDQPDVSERRTLGWSDCGHESWRPGVVLDPFAGSGTTLAVAHGHGRSAIGIDLDDRNADLAQARVGMWLGVERGEVDTSRSTPSEPTHDPKAGVRQ